MTEDGNINEWMNNIEITTMQGLPNDRGVISAIHEPEPIKTKFGDRFKCNVVLNGSDGSTITVGLFLPEQFPQVHSKSNIGKLLAKYGCGEFKDLVGKEVEIESQGEGMWKLKI